MAASAKHSAPSAPEQPNSKRAKISSLPKIALNRLDCNLDFTVEQDGITGSALHAEGFAYCWSGARANIGLKGGKYCFGCKVMQNQKVEMEDTAKDQQNLCRVGVSRGDDDVGNLGETANSFGFGGTGKFSNNGSFVSYGGRFGVGDTIVCCVDLESKPRAKIGFCMNGKWLGVAKEFDAGPTGLGILGGSAGAIFPHILLKNVKVRVLLSVDHGLVPAEGYRPWDAAADDGNAVEGPKLDGTVNEVIMMVGLPGSGKTTWAEKWAKDHPEKRYLVLGTNLALDQMKVPGLMRKRNYGERFERFMDRASKIFNQLLARAANTPRNYILDQTNVYRTARIRKLKPFRNFRKVAVVVFPTLEDLKRRTIARSREMGKEVPADAVNEMLANYVIPKSNSMLNSVEPFDEVWFPELQRDDAERCLLEMQSALPPKGSKKPESTPASSTKGSFHESLPPRGHESMPTSSAKGSFHDRNSREGSHVSIQGSYTSSYELQERNAREASYAAIPHSAYDYESPLADLYPRGSHLQSYLMNSSPYETASHGGLYPMDTHFQSYSGNPMPYETASQVPYGPGQGTSGPVRHLSMTHQEMPYNGAGPIPLQMQPPTYSRYGGATSDSLYSTPGAAIGQSHASAYPYSNTPTSRPGYGVPPMPPPRPGGGYSYY